MAIDPIGEVLRPRRTNRFVALLGGAVLTVAGVCGSAAAGDIAVDEGHIKLVTNFERIKGHLQASLELYRLGDREGAALHAEHPVDELFALLRPELAEEAPDQVEPLRSALGRPADAVAAQVSATAYERTIAGVGQALEAAQAAAVPERESDSVPFVADVLLELLESVEGEYAEGVRGQELIEPEEYQDAYGFLQRAQSLFTESAESIQEADRGAYALIRHELEELGEALPGVRPPSRLQSPDRVRHEVEEMEPELHELIGEAQSGDIDVAAHFAGVRHELEETLEAYRAGDYDEAYEESVAAYLQHYEILERVIIPEAPEWNRKLEPAFGKLRADIKARVSVDVLSDRIAAIQADLDGAERALAEDKE